MPHRPRLGCQRRKTQDLDAPIAPSLNFLWLLLAKLLAQYLAHHCSLPSSVLPLPEHSLLAVPIAVMQPEVPVPVPWRCPLLGMSFLLFYPVVKLSLPIQALPPSSSTAPLSIHPVPRWVRQFQAPGLQSE